MTGGEPLAQPAAFRALVEALAQARFNIEVETSGLNPLPEEPTFGLVTSRVPDVKAPSSGMQAHNRYDHLHGLRPGDQVKFIVHDLGDP